MHRMPERSNHSASSHCFAPVQDLAAKVEPGYVWATFRSRCDGRLTQPKKRLAILLARCIGLMQNRWAIRSQPNLHGVLPGLEVSGSPIWVQSCDCGAARTCLYLRPISSLGNIQLSASGKATLTVRVAWVFDNTA